MMNRFASLALLGAVLCWDYADAYGEAKQFLIVSSSRTHSIGYALVPNNVPQMMVLKELIPVNTGLTFPQGLAVDPWRRFLYVADPTMQQLVAYKLIVSGDDLHVGDRFVVAKDVEVRWVAVDGLGNVWFTEEPHHKVMMVSAQNLDGGITTPEIVYDGSKSSPVDAPAGIVADNYHVYWVNKLNGQNIGNVVTGLNAMSAGGTTAIAISDAKCYGIAMAGPNVFYTDEQSNLYGVPRVGGVTPTKVSTEFKEARGIAFDGMESMYVADKSQSAVFVFPANQPTLRAGLAMQKVANMDGAYGLAVYTVSEYAQAGSTSLSGSLVLAVLAILMAVRP
mmetsp:Transcript_16195/g.30188  ORF Transcript_16195/g.30188 Transcript_16195/m.30188 type:complete len:336 (+) Transcript_16195:192-1199(+)